MRTVSGRRTYRYAAWLGLAAACALLWLSLGVGIIGKDGDPANRMYMGVLAVGVAASLIARLRASGMVRGLIAMAVAQAAVAAVAVFGGLGRPYSGAAELVLLNGFFVALFSTSAWLFARAARAEQASHPRARLGHS